MLERPHERVSPFNELLCFEFGVGPASRECRSLLSRSWRVIQRDASEVGQPVQSFGSAAAPDGLHKIKHTTAVTTREIDPRGLLIVERDIPAVALPPKRLAAFM